MTSTLHDDQNTFLIIFRPFLPRMRNFSDKSCRENKNIYCMFSDLAFRKSCLLWDMWKNEVEPGKPQITIWRKSIACWYLRLQACLYVHLLSCFIIVFFTAKVPLLALVVLNTYFSESNGCHDIYLLWNSSHLVRNGRCI